MEFDADRYSARVVGARVTAATLSEIPRLDAAAQAAWAEVNWHWGGGREGRLTSDLQSVRRGHVPALGRIRVERRARWGRLHVPSCGGRCWQLGEFVAIPAQTAGTSES